MRAFADFGQSDGYFADSSCRSAAFSENSFGVAASKRSERQGAGRPHINVDGVSKLVQDDIAGDVRAVERSMFEPADTRHNGAGGNEEFRVGNEIGVGQRDDDLTAIAGQRCRRIRRLALFARQHGGGAARQPGGDLGLRRYDRYRTEAETAALAGKQIIPEGDPLADEGNPRIDGRASQRRPRSRVDDIWRSGTQ